MSIDLSAWELPVIEPTEPLRDELVAVTARERTAFIRFDNPSASLRHVVEAPGLADAITHLTIMSSVPPDLAGLSSFINVEHLHVNRLPRTVAIPPRLRSYDGPLTPHVLRSPTLTNVRLTEASFTGRSLEIEAPLESLGLPRARNLSSLPLLHHPEAIRRVAIGGRELDLTGVETWESLQIMAMLSERVTGLNYLARLQHLQTVTFANVSSADPLDAAFSLRASESIVVRGRRQPFDTALQRDLTATGSPWQFHLHP